MATRLALGLRERNRTPDGVRSIAHCAVDALVLLYTCNTPTCMWLSPGQRGSMSTGGWACPRIEGGQYWVQVVVVPGQRGSMSAGGQGCPRTEGVDVGRWSGLSPDRGGRCRPVVRVVPGQRGSMSAGGQGCPGTENNNDNDNNKVNDNDNKNNNNNHNNNNFNNNYYCYNCCWHCCCITSTTVGREATAVGLALPLSSNSRRYRRFIATGVGGIRRLAPAAGGQLLAEVSCHINWRSVYLAILTGPGSVGSKLPVVTLELVVVASGRRKEVS